MLLILLEGWVIWELLKLIVISCEAVCFGCFAGVGYSTEAILMQRLVTIELPLFLADSYPLLVQPHRFP